MTRNAPEGAFLVEERVFLHYPSTMRVYLIIINLLLPLCADAGVYRWVGLDGQVHYSDRPMTGSERFKIPDYSPVQAPKNESPVENSDAFLGSYSAFEILRPEPNQTLRDADAKVKLSLLIDPPLSDDQHVQVLLNGQAVPGDTRQTQILLRDIAYGSHRLQVQVRDELGVIIASTAPVDFHLRKPLP